MYDTGKSAFRGAVVAFDQSQCAVAQTFPKARAAPSAPRTTTMGFAEHVERAPVAGGGNTGQIADVLPDGRDHAVNFIVEISRIMTNPARQAILSRRLWITSN